MELFEAIQKRFSYRGMFKQEPVSRKDLRRIVEAALAAPSGCNMQTASLIAVDDPALIAKLGAMLGKPSFASAPAAICVLTQPLVAYRGSTYYKQDYAAAIENALLAITALGYASCWVEGRITDEDHIGRKMADALGAPRDMELVAYLPVGVPAENGPRAAKKPFEARAWFNGYGNAAQ